MTYKRNKLGSIELQVLLEKSLDLIFLCDLEGKLLETNSMLLKTLKYKNQKEIFETSIMDHIYMSQDNNAANTHSPLIFLKTLLKNKQGKVPFFIQTKKGDKIPVEGYALQVFHNDNDNIVIIANDVRDKKKLEKELKTSKLELKNLTSSIPEIRLWKLSQKKEYLDMLEQSVKLLKRSDKKYKDILESIIEGYCEVNLEGNITFFNQSFSRMLNYDPKELMGKNYKEILIKENSDIPVIDFNKIKSFNLQIQVYKKNGEKIFIETSISLKKDSEGNSVGYFGIIKDITQKKEKEFIEKKFRKRLESEVNSRTKELNELIERQKLYLIEILNASKFKTDFMSRMSHELRTPLNAIIGFTDLLLEGLYGELNLDQQEYLKDIKESSDHLLDIIEKILDISKIESGKLELSIDKINLTKFLNQINSIIIPMVKKKDLLFFISVADNIEKIYADSIRLKQILINLLSNAVKFTLQGKITLKINENVENWLFSVRDTGIGIEEKDRETIFKEFQRVNSPTVNSIPGSGLGLALTRRLVNLLGGAINFQSELGKGSTFSFNIPKNNPIKTNTPS